ncbi:TPA: restriction endonuclease subunit S [Citrobacter freundii]|nr:restriction endonuclease subunit S [Citrobacter freundii]MDK5875436.1 restriction endonuclease subunit S [Citrobacter freundii]HCR3766882.1 restriction endonuclease subunit S [Citrobacter freundii]
MMTNTFKIKYIREFCQVIDCEHKTAPYVEKSDFLVVRTSNVKDGRLIWDDMKFTTQNGYEEWTQRAIPEYGDVLFTREAPAGETCLVPKDIKMCMGQRMVLLRPASEKIDPLFFSLVLASEKIKLDILKLSIGSTVSRINIEDIKQLKVPVPSLDEQRKISKILNAWEQAILTTEKLLANSQQQKKALMQQLLTGKKRLLDDNGTRFSEIWGLYALSKLFQRVTTKNNGKSTNVVTISGQHGLIKQEDFFKKTVASDTLDGYFLLKKGQFAYNKSYSNGYPMGAIKRLNQYPEGVVTTLYICFELSTPKESFGDYWEHYFESGLLNNSLSQIAHEGGRAHGLLNVKPSDFFSLKVPVPGFEEQQKIAAVLSAADAEISTLEKKLTCLKEEKKALMQQLLTGKRRVKVDAEEAVSA